MIINLWLDDVFVNKGRMTCNIWIKKEKNLPKQLELKLNLLAYQELDSVLQMCLYKLIWFCIFVPQELFSLVMGGKEQFVHCATRVLRDHSSCNNTWEYTLEKNLSLVEYVQGHSLKKAALKNIYKMFMQLTLMILIWFKHCINKCQTKVLSASLLWWRAIICALRQCLYLSGYQYIDGWYICKLRKN